MATKRGKSKCRLTNPRQLGISWELQYKPSFEFLDENLVGEAQDRWGKMNLCEKIAIVDRLEAKGSKKGARGR
jgi:hypothetical protein